VILDKLNVFIRDVILECRSIAIEYGINLAQEKLEKPLLTISKVSDGQLISTLQDIYQGRMTEIESLNLEIARLAEDIGKSDSVCKTKLAELVFGKTQLAMAAKSSTDAG